jgi:hypothetical protein
VYAAATSNTAKNEAAKMNEEAMFAKKNALAHFIIEVSSKVNFKKNQKNASFQFCATN